MNHSRGLTTIALTRYQSHFRISPKPHQQATYTNRPTTQAHPSPFPCTHARSTKTTQEKFLPQTPSLCNPADTNIPPPRLFLSLPLLLSFPPSLLPLHKQIPSTYPIHSTTSLIPSHPSKSRKKTTYPSSPSFPHKSNQVKSSQIKSNQVKSNQIKSNQTKSSPVNSLPRPTISLTFTSTLPVRKIESHELTPLLSLFPEIRH